MNRRNCTVPDRTVSHDFDDDEGDGFGAMVGTADTLPMSQTDKNRAKKRRERLDAELGGFGFGVRKS